MNLKRDRERLKGESRNENAFLEDEVPFGRRKVVSHRSN